MNQRYSRIFVMTAGLFVSVGTVPAIGATTCENLASVALPHTKITSAQMVAAGTFLPPGVGGERAARGGTAPNVFESLPAFCRVTATLPPRNDPDIKGEVGLPASGGTGKFVAIGNGGWAGTIPYPGFADALKVGYATAGTDTGHVGNNAEFATGHPEKII